MIFKISLFPSKKQKNAEKLYARLVEQARRPGFYLQYDVPDSPEGRFDMIAMHTFLVMRRLKQGDDDAHRFSQLLFDCMFKDMDMNLREMGVGDLKVGKRVKKMAESFYGRIHAYNNALEDTDGNMLMEALKRNLYADMEDVSQNSLTGMASYMRHQWKHLEAEPIDPLTKGEVTFAAFEDI